MQGSPQVNGSERKIKVFMQHAKVVVHLRSRPPGLFHSARPPSVYFRALFASGIVPMQRLCNHKIHRHTHTGLYALLILCNTCSAITTFRLVKFWFIITGTWHELQTLAPTQQYYPTPEQQSSQNSRCRSLPSKAGWFHTENKLFYIKGIHITLKSVSCRFVASLLYQILCPLFNELMHNLAKCKNEKY